MRVARYYSNRDVRLEEIPRPRIGPGELLLRVQAAGICGSDLMEWYRRDTVPLVLGHEVSGDVAEVGEGVSRFKVGDRVVATHHVPCNVCGHCLRGNHTLCDTLRLTHFDPGGFAEYLRLEPIHVDRGVLKLPDEVSLEEGTFVEPLACVVRAQGRARLVPGSAVLVIGSGIAGLLHVLAARASGAGTIIASDVRAGRLHLARELGADHAIAASEDLPQRVRALNGGRLADLVIVATAAASALQQALGVVERGGTILFFAPVEPGVTIPLGLNEFFRNGLTLTTSYAASLADLAIALDLIRARRVNVAAMITHKLALSETGRGFGLAAEGTESVKVVIEPQR